ncbi:ROK family glucokinase [Proteinivorax hydrogeniformans]|uniref:Glucokinase n=1 Tax=Proteinivorax hydrogeniformans TaxID=1826727 RepID=A0AAU8HV83_9FIRM
MATKKSIGIDLGGTNIACALVEDGKLLHKVSIPTRAKEGKEYVFNAIFEAIESILAQTNTSKEEVEGIGIGVPGLVDIDRGVVKLAPNLFWEHVPVKEIIEKKFKLPVAVDNDANAAALGEVLNGAGKGNNDVVCITIGTGIGSGLIINGKIHHGLNGGAGEFGHVTVKEDGPLCNCGNQGCLETLTSATAIANEGMKILKASKTSILAQFVTEGQPLGAKEVFLAAEKGDKECKEVIEQACKSLGMALANVVNLLNPQQIIVGGGVSHAGDALFRPLTKWINHYSLDILNKDLSVDPAQLGNDAGIVGAAGLIN